MEVACTVLDLTAGRASSGGLEECVVDGSPWNLTNRLDSSGDVWTAVVTVSSLNGRGCSVAGLDGRGRSGAGLDVRGCTSWPSVATIRAVISASG